MNPTTNAGEPVYDSTYVKAKIKKSAIWVTRALLALYEGDRVKPVDKELFTSMIDYHERFNNISDKHVLWVRGKLIDRYIADLVELANEA